MTKTYEIEVDCAACANKMESVVAKVMGVTAVSVQFMAQKMTLSFAQGVEEAAVLSQVLKACRKIEPDFELVIK